MNASQMSESFLRLVKLCRTSSENLLLSLPLAVLSPLSFPPTHTHVHMHAHKDTHTLFIRLHLKDSVYSPLLLAIKGVFSFITKNNICFVFRKLNIFHLANNNCVRALFRPCAVCRRQHDGEVSKPLTSHLADVAGLTRRLRKSEIKFLHPCLGSVTICREGPCAMCSYTAAAHSCFVNVDLFYGRCPWHIPVNR